MIRDYKLEDLKRKEQARLWWDGIRYGEGRSYIKWNTERNDPNFLPGFNFREMGVLEGLTFVAFKQGDWQVKASRRFLEAGLEHRGTNRCSINRDIKTWQNAGHIRLKKLGREHFILLTPILLQEQYASTMGHYDEAKGLLLPRRVPISNLHEDVRTHHESTETFSNGVRTHHESACGLPVNHTQKIPCLVRTHHESDDLDLRSSLDNDASRQRSPNGHDLGKKAIDRLPKELRTQIREIQT